MTDTLIDRAIGNVFADLGLPDADERLTKTRLALALNRVLKDRGFMQADVAGLLSITQSEASALLNYCLDDVSVEKLTDHLGTLAAA